MEPLRPDVKRQILTNRPQASPADIEEYERLLAARFAVDPDQPLPPAAPTAGGITDAARLKQLHQKLFGP